MDDILEKYISKHYFPEISQSFLGNKKFHFQVRNRDPDYNFSINAHSLYSFSSNRLNSSSSSDSENQLTHFTLRHRINFGPFSICNRYRPFKEIHVLNSIIYDSRRIGIFELIQKANRKKSINSLLLKYQYKTDVLNTRTDLVYNDEGQFKLSSFVVYSFVSKFNKSTLLSEITHTTGLSLNLHLNAIKIKSLDMFYHLKLQKNQLFLAHLTRDPTVDNFFGKFIFGYMRNSNDVKTIIKLVHDYQAKETHIDLVRESKITEKAVIRNKITSGYNIGTSLTYNISDKIRLSHSAETDLRKFFKRQENYKYGIRLEVDI